MFRNAQRWYALNFDTTLFLVQTHTKATVAEGDGGVKMFVFLWDDGKFSQCLIWEGTKYVLNKKWIRGILVLLDCNWR